MVVGAVLALGALAWLLHKKKLSPEEAKAAADALATESAAQSVATNAVETANKVSEDAVVAVADVNKAEQDAKPRSSRPGRNPKTSTEDPEEGS